MVMSISGEALPSAQEHVLYDRFGITLTEQADRYVLTRQPELEVPLITEFSVSPEFTTNAAEVFMQHQALRDQTDRVQDEQLWKTFGVHRTEENGIIQVTFPTVERLNELREPLIARKLVHAGKFVLHRGGLIDRDEFAGYFAERTIPIADSPGYLAHDMVDHMPGYASMSPSVFARIVKNARMAQSGKKITTSDFARDTDLTSMLSPDMTHTGGRHELDYDKLIGFNELIVSRVPFIAEARRRRLVRQQIRTNAQLAALAESEAA